MTQTNVLKPWVNFDAVLEAIDPIGQEFGVSPAENNTSNISAPSGWHDWLRELFPTWFNADFADYHAEFWDWIWSLERGKRTHPFVAVWPRDTGKSTSAEAACVAVGARRQRRYVLYVSGIQDQADDHVANIGTMLESTTVERYYPDLASRRIGKYGHSKAWRRNRLWTASGFVVDAIGLDSAMRGAKLEDARPDFIVLDDIDKELDSPPVVNKKIDMLTKKILPAGSRDMVVLAVQNVIHDNSIFAQLAGVADENADFLTRRVVSGPHPAIRDFEYEQRNGRFLVTGGKATWQGLDLKTCQAIINDAGISAFNSEYQHETESPAGGIFSHLQYRHCKWSDLPELERVVVWVDPAVSSTDKSSNQGIQADGLGIDGIVYRLWSWERVTTPLDALKRALRKAVELKSEKVGVETDQGGATWASVYKEAWQALVDDNDVPEITEETIRPAFDSERAGSGHGPKTHRAQQMLGRGYETGKIVHVYGMHKTLEDALKRFPLKPNDLADAAYYSWYDLVGEDWGETEITDIPWL